MRRICFLLIIMVSSLVAYSQTVEKAGIIASVKGKDVTVKYEKISAPFISGEQLRLLTGNKDVILEVVYPMQTVARCRLVSGVPADVTPGVIVCLNRGERVSEVKHVEVNKKKTGTFTDNGDGTVTDNRSGLVWMKDANMANKYLSRVESIYSVKHLSVAGYTDWRIPTKDEFIQLLRDGSETLYSTFDKISDSFYWTDDGFIFSVKRNQFLQLNTGGTSGTGTGYDVSGVTFWAVRKGR